MTRLVEKPELPGNSPRRIWLASYPRSGNTFLRAILYNCFGLPSTSVYGPGDLGDNSALIRYAGHYDPDSKPPALDRDAPRLVKTHRLPPDNDPAVYVLRDGRAANVSLWEFHGRRYPLHAWIRGLSDYGTWSAHVTAWRPWERPDTLLLRYEEMVADLPAVLARLSAYLDRPVLSDSLPSRNAIADAEGRWVRRATDWQEKVNRRHLQHMAHVDGPMLSQLGYAAVIPPPERPPALRAAQHTMLWMKVGCCVAYSGLRHWRYSPRGLRWLVRRLRHAVKRIRETLS